MLSNFIHSSLYIDSASLLLSNIFLPKNEYISVPVIFSRIELLSPSLLFRNFVNSPCASRVVRQNWLYSMSMASFIFFSISPFLFNIVFSYSNVRLDASILLFLLYRNSILALYSILSLPVNSKMEKPSLVPLLKYCRSSESLMYSLSADDFCGDDCSRGDVPYSDSAIQSNMVDFPVPVVPQIKNSEAVDSGSALKSIVASSIDAILCIVSLFSIISFRLFL